MLSSDDSEVKIAVAFEVQGPGVQFHHDKVYAGADVSVIIKAVAADVVRFESEARSTHPACPASDFNVTFTTDPADRVLSMAIRLAAAAA